MMAVFFKSNKKIICKILAVSMSSIALWHESIEIDALAQIPPRTFNDSVRDIHKSSSNSPEKPSCQATVDRVIQEIKNKGVRRVQIRIDKHYVNNTFIGNPTQRTDMLDLTLGGMENPQEGYPDFHQVDSIMASTKLLNFWSNQIVRACGNTAIVSFGMARTDWSKSFFIQADGTTKENTCITNDNIPKTLPWGVEICL